MLQIAASVVARSGYPRLRRPLPHTSWRAMRSYSTQGPEGLYDGPCNHSFPQEVVKPPESQENIWCHETFGRLWNLTEVCSTKGRAGRRK